MNFCKRHSAEDCDLCFCETHVTDQCPTCLSCTECNCTFLDLCKHHYTCDRCLHVLCSDETRKVECKRRGQADATNRYCSDLCHVQQKALGKCLCSLYCNKCNGKKTEPCSVCTRPRCSCCEIDCRKIVDGKPLGRTFCSWECHYVAIAQKGCACLYE